MGKTRLEKRVTERGKPSKWVKKYKAKYYDIENIEDNMSMKKNYREVCNIKYAPIKRVLTSMIGQNIDDVYNEILSNLTPKYKHLVKYMLDHIIYQKREIIIENNKVMRRYSFDKTYELRNKSFYVYDGILYQYSKKNELPKTDPFTIKRYNGFTREIIEFTVASGLRFKVKKGVNTNLLTHTSYAFRNWGEYTPWTIAHTTFSEFLYISHKNQYKIDYICGPFEAIYG